MHEIEPHQGQWHIEVAADIASPQLLMQRLGESVSVDRTIVVEGTRTFGATPEIITDHWLAELFKD